MDINFHAKHVPSTVCQYSWLLPLDFPIRDSCSLRSSSERFSPSPGFVIFVVQTITIVEGQSSFDCGIIVYKKCVLTRESDGGGGTVVETNNLETDNATAQTQHNPHPNHLWPADGFHRQQAPTMLTVQRTYISTIDGTHP